MARNTSKPAAPKGKFNGMIHRTSDEVLKGRGDRIIKSAKLSQEAIVRTLEAWLDDAPDYPEDQLGSCKYTSAGTGNTHLAAATLLNITL